MQRIATFFSSYVHSMMSGGGAPSGAWQHDAPTPDFRVRWERAAAHFTSLPLEMYYDRLALERMSIKELKAVLVERAIPLTGLCEKADLVAKVLEGVGPSSSCEGCSICSEAYVAGEDLVRVLPCLHRFHCECIDRWFLNPVDYSRRPSCPLCKVELPAFG